jgi:hypothetical protein
MTSEVQRFDILGSPGSGKFTLAFNSSEPSTQIAYHPPAGDVQRALEALSTIGVGNVVVSKDGNWGYVCAFGGALGDQDLPLLVADDSQLGGGGTIQVSTVTEGFDPNTEVPPEPEVPPGVPGATLPTPCSLIDLLVFAQNIAAYTPGRHHQPLITTTATGITAGW